MMSGTSTGCANSAEIVETIEWRITAGALELDVVELTEDLPKYGLKKGERGVVTAAFDEPDEAYDLEFVNESGTSSSFAYSVKPEQITNVYDLAKECLG